jgi:hypothetical protein
MEADSMMTLRKTNILVVSLLLAYLSGEGLFPTPNGAGGGAARLCILIHPQRAFGRH